MHGLEHGKSQRLFSIYYGGTLLFVLLDYLFDFNIRVSFLEQWPGWRALYYVFCFACLATIRRHPAWSNIVAAAESLLNLSALILSMAVRVMIVSEAMIEDLYVVVTVRELINFLLSGSAAYLALLVRGRAAHKDLTG